MIIFIILYSYYIPERTEGFTDNLLEQQMFQGMTEENKEIYLELEEDKKQNMFNSWRNQQNL